MFKKIGLFLIAAVLCVIPFAAAQDQTQPQSAQDLEIVKSLAGKLAVKPEQAAGGAGAIFGLAKTRLSPEDFTKVSTSVPGMDLLLKSAPAADGPAGALQKMAPSASGLASLTGSFEKLGLSPDMIGKFTPEILTFVEGKGGSEAKTILSGVLK